MPIDPLLLPILPSFGHLPATIENPAALREIMNSAIDAAFDQFSEVGPDTATREFLEITTPERQVAAALYRPPTAGPHPVHIYLHGGGWMMGSAFSKDSEAVSRYRSAHADCIVVSLDYSKAPEDPFPAPVNDLLALVDWIDQNAYNLGALPGAITVGGQSSGANIAAAGVLALRNAGRSDIGFQLLEVPVLDLSHGITRETGEELRLSMADIRTFSSSYINGADPSESTLSPLLADDLSELPPTYIAVAEHDVLRVDGEKFADRLRLAGVPVDLYVGLGHVHVSPSMTRLLPSARRWRAASVEALRRANDLLRSAGEA